MVLSTFQQLRLKFGASDVKAGWREGASLYPISHQPQKIPLKVGTFKKVTPSPQQFLLWDLKFPPPNPSLSRHSFPPPSPASPPPTLQLYPKLLTQNLSFHFCAAKHILTATKCAKNTQPFTQVHTYEDNGGALSQHAGVR